MPQVTDNISTCSPLKPLSPIELRAVEKVRRILSGGLIPCTGCKYCEGCPAGIKISEVLHARNQYALYKSAPRFKEEFARITVRPDACTHCGYCKTVCPQALDIPAHLKNIAGEYAEL
jgi:predicted aldo/keto reductase-like oxidoreductase